MLFYIVFCVLSTVSSRCHRPSTMVGVNLNVGEAQTDMA